MNYEEDKIKSFRDLNSWKEAHKLTLSIYTLTKNFPDEERYGLVTQMRRASVSMTSNIAEGFSRYSYADKCHFYSMALGSSTELHNQLLIAHDLIYINDRDFQAAAEQCIIVNKLLNGLIKRSKIIHNS